jgi:hypothetical protein
VEYPQPPSDVDMRKHKEEIEKYDPHAVAEMMYAKKERKIPGSVLKPHSPYVHLVQSNVMGVSEKSICVYFPYPKYCYQIKTQPSFLSIVDRVQEIKRQPNRAVKIVHQYKMMDKNMSLGFKVHDSTHIYNSVVNAMKAAGVRIMPPNSRKWNIIWVGVCKPDLLKEATKYQKINHFPQSFQLGRKD